MQRFKYYAIASVLDLNDRELTIIAPEHLDANARKHGLEQNHQKPLPCLADFEWIEQYTVLLGAVNRNKYFPSDQGSQTKRF